MRVRVVRVLLGRVSDRRERVAMRLRRVLTRWLAEMRRSHLLLLARRLILVQVAELMAQGRGHCRVP